MSTGLPLSGRAAVAPALVASAGLAAVGLGYALAQSLGLLPLAGPADLSLDAYRDLASGRVASDLWSSSAFTLWVAAASTLLAMAGALGLVAWLEQRPRRDGRVPALLHVNLAIPHVVWAAGLLLVLSQSGLIARAAAAVGLVSAPAGFPVLVRDRFGLGIIVHYALKEVPFLSLVALALLRAQPRELELVARTLGARGWRWARLYLLPTVAPGVAAAGALVFVFVVGAYEAPVALGVSSPRMLSVLGIDLFNSPNLADRPAAMALGVAMTFAAAASVAAASLAVARWWRR